MHTFLMSDVSKRFLEKVGLRAEERQGTFLRDGGSAEVILDALRLFDFLHGFGQRELNDFKTGLPYLISKSSIL